MSQKTIFRLDDIDLDLLTSCSSDFKDTMHSIGLYYLITRPTRINTHGATVIDNIFTSLINDDISDHLPICWSLSFK